MHFRGFKKRDASSHRRRLFSSPSCAPNSPGGILAISKLTYTKSNYIWGSGFDPSKKEKCTLAPPSCCEPPKRRRTMGLRTGETPSPNQRKASHRTDSIPAWRYKGEKERKRRMEELPNIHTVVEVRFILHAPGFANF